jgi:cyclopropane-fatty-acyl-phospholipid synthase
MERYVAPDMHMRPLVATLSLLEAAGLEVVDVHGLREH